MKVVVKRVGKNPTVKTISDNNSLTNCLADLQTIVGGYIEEIKYPVSGMEDMLLICNEEGKLKQLAPNFFLNKDVIVGDVCFLNVRENESGENEYCSLTKPQINFLLKKYCTKRS